MQMTQLARALGRNDVKLIGRDRFLLMIFGFALYIAVALRYGLPWLNTYLADKGVLPSETLAQSLADYYPLIVVFMAVLQGAMMSGVIFGFMLLDEKDDNTIKAMLVTPVPLNHYVLYRVMLPSLLGFLIVVGMVLFIDLVLLPLWQLVVIAAGASLVAPITALFYAIFAENKVQGFAVAKFVSLITYVVVWAWFVPEPWQWLFGLFPPYWICKAYWMALDGHGLWWLALLLGIVLQAGLLLVMVHRFKKVAYR